MADKKISAFTAASALAGTEVMAGVQSGADRKISANQIKDLTYSSISGLTAASALDGTELFVALQGGNARKVTADQINAAIACSVYLSTTQTIGSTDVVAFDTEYLDTHNAFDTSSHLFTAPIAGLYMMVCSFRVNALTALSFETIGGGASRVQVGMSGTTGFETFISFSEIYNLASSATMYCSATLVYGSGDIDQGKMTIHRIGS